MYLIKFYDYEDTLVITWAGYSSRKEALNKAYDYQIPIDWKVVIEFIK